MAIIIPTHSLSFTSLIDEQAGDIRLQIRADDGELGPAFPPGVDELRLEVTDRVEDLAKLRALFDVLAQTLQRLCEVGCAIEQDPDVDL